MPPVGRMHAYCRTRSIVVVGHASPGLAGYAVLPFLSLLFGRVLWRWDSRLFFCRFPFGPAGSGKSSPLELS